MPITKIAFIRSTVLAILVGVGALVAIVAFNFWLVEQARITTDQVTAARQQRGAIIDIRNSLADLETGQRGFLLTGDQDYLSPYTNAEQRLPGQIERVRELTDKDAVQRDAFAKLIPIIEAKRAELARTIELYNAGQRDSAMVIVKANSGREIMEQARTTIAAMVVRAEDRIQEVVQSQRESISQLQMVTIAGAIVILLVVGGAVWTVLLYTRQLIEAQREVQTLNVGLEERVRERTADLGRANEEIQRFAYIVTHDLRAPLVNIMGFTSELEGCLTAIQDHVKQTDEASEDPVVKGARAAALDDLPEAINFIRSSTRKMDGLINAILKLSREGRRVLKPETIELHSLLETAAASVQHQVTDAGGEVKIEGSVPPVVSDRLALEQVFGNLLDNAVKYRAKNRPLKIRIRAAQERGQRIVVEVEDNGRGIAKQDHERIFDLFRRSGSQDQPGEGIGLAHVRTMVRNLGGDITLQSELERGTTMKINLPRDLRQVLSMQKVMSMQAGAA
ncbi:sensor histidine kinase [Rhodoplanes sp. Z2-YC6860]|uniref:sensor histidine kinase n=1 Tax=Rhodoplanes sp. Z2-YC6860 TaxID=674703 RepID=UPI00078B4ECC|nr:CHASE3 domain-containing protein [Rhodoplanes sp. Z2-YC6860]AMN42179.1 Sensory box histidine kinase [Rhodoplanes sp. Z2-YC6860]